MQQPDNDPAPLRELHALINELERRLREVDHAPGDSFVREVVFTPINVVSGGQT